MRAMVLAAGVGRRLTPLTDERPKALVEVAGVPLIALVLKRLEEAGVRDVVVNAFHHAGMLEAYLRALSRPDFRIEISREPERLDTGGGLKKAAAFFSDGEPFLVHNTDVVSTVDLRRLLAEHASSGALATLSVRARESSRRLLFDSEGRLCNREKPGPGRGSDRSDLSEHGPTPCIRLPPVDRAETGSASRFPAPDPAQTPLAFDGIQAVSPAIFGKLTETGPFSLVEAYLRLAREGERILAFRADEYEWSDAGTPERLEAIRKRGRTSKT